MNRKNFCIGMGMGLFVGSTAMMIMRPKKRRMKSTVGRTLRNVGELVDSACETMGW